MKAHVLSHFYPLHCGGIHLSDQMIVNLVLLSSVSAAVLFLVWATGRDSASRGK